MKKFVLENVDELPEVGLIETLAAWEVFQEDLLKECDTDEMKKDLQLEGLK